MGNFFDSKKSLSIPEQDKKIKIQFPEFQRIRNLKKGIWVGNLNPTKWSPKYKIQITYDMKKTPQVTVIKPKLICKKGEKHLPHVYPNNVLCLFDPDKKEWDNTKSIADTTIPWISLWLFYYEEWLYTGKWEGGGRHPNIKQKTKKKKKHERIKI
ncbi:MAG: hypothetical protein OXK80_04315 [Bdellovibrionales bacterium]|nr:hypothetical protein [Bdellovibrionales bacterium]